MLDVNSDHGANIITQCRRPGTDAQLTSGEHFT